MLLAPARLAAAASVAALALLASPCAGQGAFGTYGSSYRAITMPANPPGSTQLVGGALADGRLLLVSGLSVLRESAPGSSLFETVALLDSAAMGGNTDAAFLRISPDGQSVAVGGGLDRPIAVFPVGALPASGLPILLSPGTAAYFDVPHYDAAWADDSRLALSAGPFGLPAQITLLDTASDPAAPSNRTIVTNIAGASAGVAFDSAGRLYTGNGFAYGPGGSTTGTIRIFERSATIDGAAPADFETSGVLLGDVLSAGPLLFDAEGNLVVGGGDIGAADTGYLGVVNAQAIAAALAGLGPIDPSDPTMLLRLTPAADPFAFYGGAYNPVTGELYAALTDFATGQNTWYATVPAPGGAALILVTALAAGRRRRA